MILNCEKCGTRYLVPASAIGAEGRTVRCTSCAHEWFQEPEEAPASFAEAVEAVEVEPIPDGVRPLPEGSELPVIAGTIRTKRRRRLPPADRLAGYGAAAAVFVLIAGILAALQGPLTRAWPPAAGFYALTGMSAPVPGEGLSFEGVAATAGTDAEGLPVLTVEGHIVNDGHQPVAVPPVHAVVYDAKGAAVARMKTPAPKKLAAPGEKLAFHAVYPKAAGMEKINVSFAAAPDSELPH